VPFSSYDPKLKIAERAEANTAKANGEMQA
jgi:hypothetical protein